MPEPQRRIRTGVFAVLLTAWAIGDWILAGEKLYGERAAQGVEATGRSKATLQEYARVAQRFPPPRRRLILSFSHHQLVAAREPEEQEEWLDRAEANRWSKEELHGMLRAALPVRQTVPVALLEDIARAILRAAVPGKDGWARVPVDVLERLANALGQPLDFDAAPAQRLVEVPASSRRPEWA